LTVSTSSTKEAGTLEKNDEHMSKVTNTLGVWYQLRI
jgi:hypothetical protein